MVDRVVRVPRRSCLARGADGAADDRAATSQHRERGAIAAQRELLDRRRAGSGVTHGHRPQRRLVAQHHGRPTIELQFHLYWNAWRNTDSTWMRERLRAGRGPGGRYETAAAAGRATGATSTSRPSACSPAAAPARRPDGQRRLHRARRRQPGRPDRVVGAAAAAVAPGESVTVELAWTARVPRTFARTGAIGNYFFIAQWFPKLGVLEDTGWNTPPVPRRHRVLRRLRRVRRADHRAARLGRRRDRPRARRDGHAKRHDDASLRAGRRPRLRVDDQPGLRREDGDLRAPDPAAHRVAAAAAARARRSGRAALRRDASGAKYYGEWFGPYPYGHLTDRRSGLAKQRRRHGVPDAVHRGHTAGSHRRSRRSRRRDRSRGRPPVLVRPGGQQRVRARVAGRRAQPVLDLARAA